MAADPPNITLTGEDGAEVAKRTIKFQCGLLRETETFMGEDVDILCRETLLDYICEMLSMKVSISVQKTRHAHIRRHTTLVMALEATLC